MPRALLVAQGPRDPTCCFITVPNASMSDFPILGPHDHCVRPKQHDLLFSWGQGRRLPSLNGLHWGIAVISVCLHLV